MRAVPEETRFLRFPPPTLQRNATNPQPTVTDVVRKAVPKPKITIFRETSVALTHASQDGNKLAVYSLVSSTLRSNLFDL